MDENPEFEIITLKSGHRSLRSRVHEETFHPVTGPLAEAGILHVGQQRLVERSRAARGSRFVIWDVGFGAAANAIAAIEALRDGETEIELQSFDKSTTAIEFALRHAEELGYLTGYEELLAQLLKVRSVRVSPCLQWRLHLGDFSAEETRRTVPAPHAVFYDPYSPMANPEMWTLQRFTALRQCLEPGVPCLVTNYTRSTAVRVTLLLSGFFVGRGCEVGEKAETTVASNVRELIRQPLDSAWLERVRKSTNAEPRQANEYSKGPISEANFARLRSCPQFRP